MRPEQRGKDEIFRAPNPSRFVRIGRPACDPDQRFAGKGIDRFAAPGVNLEAKAWQNVKTYDVRVLNKDLRGHIGEFTALKFTFRGKDIHHMKPGWYEASIWQPDPRGKKGFSDVRVMVAKKDLEAF